MLDLGVMYCSASLLSFVVLSVFRLFRFFCFLYGIISSINHKMTLWDLDWGGVTCIGTNILTLLNLLIQENVVSPHWMCVVFLI